MSNTGIKLLASTELVVDPVPLYRTHYKPTQNVLRPSGTIFDSGGIEMVITDAFTESTFNLAVQQAVADNANLETEGVEAFTSTDVYGGRI